jgi:hypothetical protein
MSCLTCDSDMPRGSAIFAGFARFCARFFRFSSDEIHHDQLAAFIGPEVIERADSGVG